jgi:cysteine synthase
MEILDAIGNTSMVRLQRVTPRDCADILVKLGATGLTTGDETT